MEIEKIFNKHKRLMIDTAPVIYFIEEHSNYGNISEKLFRIIRDDYSITAFSSVITLIEVLTQPFRKSLNNIADKYRTFLLHSSNFIIYPVDTIIAEKSAQLRAKYDMKTPDAIQISVGLENEATLFITNDKELKRIKEIEVLILEDYL